MRESGLELRAKTLPHLCHCSYVPSGDITFTPLLTALGAGGLAVALALQDTLANLFAGIHILVEEAITVGDSMRL